MGPEPRHGLACCTMVKEPEIRAWLAMTDAPVAMTTAGQRSASGTLAQ